MKRFARLRHILSLDPAYDFETIYRLLAEYEFPWDITRSLELALFRTYAVPSIGRLLDRTGEFARCPQQRYDDTTLLLFEIMHSGSESGRGRQALRHLNQIHGRYRISNDDYRYTLATFVVAPVRWINAYGWRTLHPVEVEAITNTMHAMGNGMGITAIPETYDEFATLLDTYESEHFEFDPGGRRVADATLQLFASWFPSALSTMANSASRALMDHHLLQAFGYPIPSRGAQVAAHAAMRLRANLIRIGPARPDSRPVHPKPLTYPSGYGIDELGPAAFHRSRARRARDASPQD